MDEIHTSAHTINRIELYQLASMSRLSAIETDTQCRTALPIMIILKVVSGEAQGWGKVTLMPDDSHFDLQRWARQLERLKGKSAIGALLLLEQMRTSWCEEKVQLTELALANLLQHSSYRYCPQQSMLITHCQAYYGTI
ncbi:MULTISPECIES: hypothetical protein [unclassified Paenibacillus]|uniref:hypothetical protein n=1 Tax=unclassified Paenibacillus TaxID=185978 RepID=UPI001EF742E8|nr:MULTISPECIES: hypothetical protein [unclassified Paenibacillus]